MVQPVSRNIAGNRGGSTINHTYSQTGTYQVNVTASSPGMTNIPANPVTVTVGNAPAACNPSGTPVICASGIIQYTSNNQCILANNSACAGLPSSCNATYFTVLGVTDAYSVQWERMIEGSNTWTVYQPDPPGGGGFVTSVPFHVVHTESYFMRAKVKFCDASIVYSSGYLIKNRD
jgi:PKD repeat protein